MNMLQATPPKLPVSSSHRETLTEAQVVAAVTDTAITSRRWHRPTLGQRASDLARWADGFPSCGRFVIARRRALSNSMDELMAGICSQETARWLALDIRKLAGLYLALSAAKACRIKLDLITRQACRRFHYDYLTLRMLCTYSGEGTLWVAREDVHVPALDDTAGDIDAQNARIVPDRARVRACEAGDVLWLKGALHPDTGGIGAVHRSPFASPEKPRLVLTIDAQLSSPE